MILHPSRLEPKYFQTNLNIRLWDPNRDSKMDSQNIFNQNVDSLGVMQDLVEEILNIQKQNDRSEEALNRMTEIVRHSNAIVHDSDCAREMVLDAKVLNISSQVVRSDILSFDTNLTSFNPDDYGNGLLLYVSEGSLISDINWDMLSSVSCSIFKTAPATSYMLGPLKLETLPPKEKTKHTRNKNTTAAVKKILPVAETEHSSEEMSDGVYQHILKSLILACRQNGKQPVNYFKFVIDPHDFWRSIENIFHFSFLVRDDMVKMMLDEDGIPVIQPRSKDNKVIPGEKRLKNQFNFRLTVEEWKNCISIFNITSAMIPSFTKK